jgi:hypothetical protein
MKVQTILKIRHQNLTLLQKNKTVTNYLINTKSKVSALKKQRYFALTISYLLHNNNSSPGTVNKAVNGLFFANLYSKKTDGVL